MVNFTSYLGTVSTFLESSLNFQTRDCNCVQQVCEVKLTWSTSRSPVSRLGATKEIAIHRLEVSCWCCINWVIALVYMRKPMLSQFLSWPEYLWATRDSYLNASLFALSNAHSSVSAWRPDTFNALWIRRRKVNRGNRKMPFCSLPICNSLAPMPWPCLVLSLK